MKQYAVIGPGALGCLIAAKLHQAGHPVLLIDYQPERIAYLNSHNIAIENETDSESIPITAAIEIPSGSRIIICVKSHQLDAVLKKHAPAFRNGEIAIIVQNGLSWLQKMKDIDALPIAGGIAYMGVRHLGTGQIKTAGDGDLCLGLVSAEGDDILKDCAADLISAGFNVSQSSDIQTDVWKKVIVNAAINPLSVIYDCPNGELLNPKPLQHMQQIVRETVSIARAAGIMLMDDEMFDLVTVTCRRTAANVSSMLSDVRAGQRTEIDAIIGAIILEGEKLGIPAPVCQEIAQMPVFGFKNSGEMSDE